MSALIECDRCDGCGWYEGGQALRTSCERCGGTGAVDAAPARRTPPPSAPTCNCIGIVDSGHSPSCPLYDAPRPLHSLAALTPDVVAVLIQAGDTARQIEARAANRGNADAAAWVRRLDAGLAALARLVPQHGGTEPEVGT